MECCFADEGQTVEFSYLVYILFNPFFSIKPVLVISYTFIQICFSRFTGTLILIKHKIFFVPSTPYSLSPNQQSFVLIALSPDDCCRIRDNRYYSFFFLLFFRFSFANQPHLCHDSVASQVHKCIGYTFILYLGFYFFLYQ